MSSGSDKGIFEKVRGARDSAMEDLAKVTLAWTSSDSYQAINAAISKPTLLAAAIFRKAADSAMADLLARLNLPSREDVLALSQRLTRLEMALDDVGAGLDQLRRESSQKQRPSPLPSRSRAAGRQSADEGRMIDACLSERST
jgi:hypothetical protein